MARLVSYQKTWRQVVESARLAAEGSKKRIKTVTRREGFWIAAKPCHRCYAWGQEATCGHGAGCPRLKPGEVLEAIQWSPRVGKRWVCVRCLALGSTRVDAAAAVALPCPHKFGVYADYRKPQRGIFLRHIESRREPLSAITPEEVALEGFPGESPDWFRSMAFPGRPWSFEVTRIAFNYEPNQKET